MNFCTKFIILDSNDMVLFKHDEHLTYYMTAARVVIGISAWTTLLNGFHFPSSFLFQFKLQKENYYFIFLIVSKSLIFLFHNNCKKYGKLLCDVNTKNLLLKQSYLYKKFLSFTLLFLCVTIEVGFIWDIKILFLFLFSYNSHFSRNLL